MVYSTSGARILLIQREKPTVPWQKYNTADEKAEELGYSRYSERLKRIREGYIFEAEQNALIDRQSDDEDY